MARDVVHIDDLKLRMMMTDVRFTSMLPCLAKAAQQVRNIPKKCGRCARKQQKERANIYRSARNCIATLSEEQVGAVKKLLHANKLKVTKVKRGKTVPVTR